MIKNKKTLYAVIISVLFCCCVGLLFNANSPTESVQTVSAADKYYSLSVDGESYDTDINSSSAVVRRRFPIKCSADLANEFINDDSYNHFLFVYGRRDMIEFLYKYRVNIDYTPLYCTSNASDYFDSNGFDFGSTSSKLHDCLDNLIAHDKTGTLGYTAFEAGDVSSQRIYNYINFAKNATNLFDYGYFIEYYYSTVFSFDLRADRYPRFFSPRSDFENIVSRASNYSENTVGAYEKALGIYKSGNTTVTCNYYTSVSNGFNKWEPASFQISVPSVYVPDKEYVWQQILNSNYVNGRGLVAFNVNYVPTSTGVFQGDYISYETFGSRTIRQANGYDYSYSSGSIPSDVSVNIQYSDYKYSDFFARISNNNSEVDNELAIDYFPTVSAANGKYYLTFDCQEIIDKFGNTLRWSVADGISFTWNESDVKPHVSVTSEYDSVTQEDGSEKVFLKKLIVAFDDGYQNNLFGLQIEGLAQITPSTAFDCKIAYKNLDESLIETDSEYSIENKVYDMDFGELNAAILSETSDYAKYVYDSINPTVLHGITYMEPIYVVYEANYETQKAIFIVEYSYKRVLVVRNDKTDDIFVAAYNDGLSEQRLSAYNVTLPDNYRSVGIKDYDEEYITVSLDKDNALNSVFSLNSAKTGSIDMTLVLSDKWVVVINYLTQYENSCFAEMQTEKLEIKVSDYENVRNLSASDLCTILGKEIEFLNFSRKSVKISEINVSFNEKTLIYEINLTYTRLSLKATNSDGSSYEMLIGLTPFSEWCNSFGQDWSILYLAPEVFKYEDDVDKDKLYGFFSIVTFKEQISNFNSWFKQFTGDGCTTVFSQKEVKGSGFYKFMNENAWLLPTIGTLAGTVTGFFLGNPVGGAVGGAAVGTMLDYAVLSMAEAANDENGTYYSYFFYLDGTSDKSYVAHNGADSYEDESSAVKNFGEDVSDWLNGVVEQIKSSPFFTVISIIFGVVVALFVIGILVNLFKWIFKDDRRNR